MPGYVSNVLSKFQHDSPKHPQHTPSRYITPVYGAKTQYATTDETTPLTAHKCLTIQKVTGSVLYYDRAVDPTVLMPLNDIVTEQAEATEKTRPAQSHTLRAGPHTTPTPLRTDNSTAYGIVKDSIEQKRSKEMEMRYHWLTDRVCQKQFDVYGTQDVKISQIITQSIIQCNIKKICAP
jgi:hypothetical protein